MEEFAIIMFALCLGISFTIGYMTGRASGYVRGFDDCMTQWHDFEKEEFQKWLKDEQC